MRNLLITLSFCGTKYSGYQVQANGISVAEKIQDAIELVTNYRSDLIGCSRTDSGVHANMYCANFHTNSQISTNNMIRGLNRHLPEDIVVYNCQQKPDNFHARYDAKTKEYIYKILNKPTRSPFIHHLTYHYRYPLDLDILNDAAKYFIGTHDFAAFCGSKNTQEKTIRTVFDAGFTRSGDIATFIISGDGFLYNMVRIIVGTLLAVNQGKIHLNSIYDIIRSGDRSLAGPTAKAKGLYLNKVVY